MDKYEIDFYEDQNGDSPVFDFIKSLKKRVTENKDKTSRTLLESIYRKLKRLEVNGTRDGMPDFESMDGCIYKIWQIRIKHVTGYYRIFICQNPYKKNVFVILNYYVKKSDKTDERQLKLADRLMKDYLKRKEGSV